MSSIEFLLCNLFLTIFGCIFLLLKYILKKCITVKVQYFLWYLFVCALFLPFIPHQILTDNSVFFNLTYLLRQTASHTLSASSFQNSTTVSSSLPGHSEIASSPASLAAFDMLFAGIWVIGCVISFLFLLYRMFQIYTIKKSTYLISSKTEPDLYSIYISCMKTLNIKRTIPLYGSCHLSSPVSYGIFRPCIIIPQDMDILLSPKEIRFVFLHELQHYKQKDSILNGLICILQILYWFHPFIRCSFHLLQKDREIACDHAVICTIGQEYAVPYGYALLQYASCIKQSLIFSPFSGFVTKHSLLSRRIKELVTYRPDSFLRRLSGAVFSLILCIFLIFASPFLKISAFTNSSYHSLVRNVETIDLSSYFPNHSGTFVLYDSSKNLYRIHNPSLSRKRVSPDSTFKIYSGLFALEEHLITPEESTQDWNGISYPFDTWNQDQTFHSAMTNSVNWYFQNLDMKLGYSRLSSYYRKISYGNCDLSFGIKDYWAESSLKISPMEQVNLLSDLLQNKWHFNPQNIQIVKDALFLFDTPSGALYGKTGTGLRNGKNANGWFVGFLEKGEHFYCFATNLSDSDGKSASKITMEILGSLLLLD
nr:BlaR1 family beta-lactam sensor/signal transducer [uncultured Sellimonas sp.]